MLVELGKYGLGERDLVANINFFSKVDRRRRRRDAARQPAMRAPGNTWICASRWTRWCCCTPVRIRWRRARRHAPAGVLLQARRAAPPGPDDVCRTRCPENARGFINTERLYLGASGGAS